MVPGSNLLRLALTVIAPQIVNYYEFIDRVTNDVGIDESKYAEPVTIFGSVQPIPRSMYELLGLDLQKVYINFYSTHPVIDLARDISGDRIGFNGKLYQCLSNNDWSAVDGWQGTICVEVSEEVVDNDFYFTDDAMRNQYFTDDAMQNAYVSSDIST
jgi:hypothetical protein